MWELDYKESWAPKNWCFWTVVWRGLLRVPWTARRSNQSILKEISPVCSLEGLMLKLKLQYFGHLMRTVDSLEKTLILGQEEKGTTEDEMAGWHHWLDGHESEWTPGVDDGQGGLVCCDSWGCKEWDTTEWLNWTGLYPLDASSILHFNGPKMFPDIAKFSLSSTGEEKLPQLRTTALYVGIDVQI